MKKKYIKMLVYTLVFFIFLLGVIMLINSSKEKYKRDIYKLRNDIIKLKMQNRELQIEYRKIININNVEKWAEKNNFTEKWDKTLYGEKNEK